MKKYFYFAFSLLFAFLSCTNDSNLLNDQNANVAPEECIVISNMDELNAFLRNNSPFSLAETSAYEAPTEAQSASGYCELHVEYGYDRIYDQNFHWVFFTPAMASIIGIPSANYYCIPRMAEITIEATLEGIPEYEIHEADSPLCGFAPGYSYETIGYTMRRIEDSLKFFSYELHILHNDSGVTVDKHYPRKAEDFRWNYYRVYL